MKPTSNKHANERHESHGLLSLARVEGKIDLYGSPLRAHSFVTLRITEAYEEHQLGKTWRHAGPIVAEVHMSHVQFAEAITTMNRGVGVPCTIALARDGKGLHEYEACPPQSSEAKLTREEFRRKVEERMGAMIETRKRVSTLLEEGNVTAKRRAQIESEVEQVFRLFTDSTPFLMKCFEENAEKVVASAKAEISAHADLVAHTTGVVLLKSQSDVPALDSGSAL